MADRYVNYDKLLEARHRLGLDEMSKIHKVNAFNQFIDNLPTADVVEMPKWIDVNERLPEPNAKDESNFFLKAYLVARCNGFTMHTALWNGDYWVLWTKGTVLKDVTHWQPLPEPPSGAKMRGDTE